MRLWSIKDLKERNDPKEDLLRQVRIELPAVKVVSGRLSGTVPVVDIAILLLLILAVFCPTPI